MYLVFGLWFLFAFSPGFSPQKAILFLHAVSLAQSLPQPMPLLLNLGESYMHCCELY